MFWTLLALVAARAAAPEAIRGYANRTLGKLKGLRGHIGGVDLALWRGAFRVSGIRIDKEIDGMFRPLLAVGYVDVGVRWGPLLRGALVASAIVDHPVAEVWIEEAEPGAAAPRGLEDLQSQLRELLPVRIDRVTLRDGFVRVRRVDGKPPSDIRVADVQATASNLSNSERLSGTLVASIRATAKLFGGRLRVDLRADPLASPPVFDLDAGLRGGSMPALNELLRAYGGFDAEGGSFDFFVEAAAAEGRVRGYVKTVFDGLKLFSGGERRRDARQAFWEALVAASAEVLQNQPKERLAARVPFEGPLEHPGVRLWPAVASVLRNAFVRAMFPRLERSVRVEFGRRRAK